MPRRSVIPSPKLSTGRGYALRTSLRGSTRNGKWERRAPVNVLTVRSAHSPCRRSAEGGERPPLSVIGQPEPADPEIVEGERQHADGNPDGRPHAPGHPDGREDDRQEDIGEQASERRQQD